MFTREIFLLLVLTCVPAHSNTVRLISPLNNGIGRLEVLYNGTWGTVCRDGFFAKEVGVACRQLGLGGKSPPKAVYVHAGGSGTIWLDDVKCNGTESSLEECDHSPWGTHNCQHNKDVAIDCGVANVRLSFYPTGQLQIYKNDTWGTVCFDNFGKVESTVACRSFGYNSGDASARSSSSLPMLLTGVECSLNDTDITSCKHSHSGVSDCSSGKTVGVRCYSFGDGSTDIRLNCSSNTPDEGRLEVKYRGRWGTVSYRGFGSPEAKVVCNMLGYYSGGKATLARRPLPKSARAFLSFVKCKGTENDINDCAHSLWNSYSFDHSEDVYVKCANDVPNVHVHQDVATINVFVGDNITVNCVSDDAVFPLTSITWYHNGRVSSGVKFNIPSVRQSDEGRLTCTADNGAGTRSGRTDTLIRVLEKCEACKMPEKHIADDMKCGCASWTTIHTVSVVAGVIAVVIIAVLALIIVQLLRKLSGDGQSYENLKHTQSNVAEKKYPDEGVSKKTIA